MQTGERLTRTPPASICIRRPMEDPTSSDGIRGGFCLRGNQDGEAGGEYVPPTSMERPQVTYLSALRATARPSPVNAAYLILVFPCPSS